MELAVNESDHIFMLVTSESAKYDVFVALLGIISMFTAYNS